MKQLTCEMCGSIDLVKQDGVFVCQTCGCKYSIEEAKKMMIDGTVEVTGTVKVDNSAAIANYLKMAQSAIEARNNKEAEEYANKIIELDPQHCEAWAIKGEAAGWQSTCANPRITDAVTAWLNAISYASDEERSSLRETIANKFTALMLAMINLRCKNFATIQSTENKNEVEDEIDNCLDLMDRLMTVGGVSFNRGFTYNEIADSLNGAAVSGFEDAKKDFGPEHHQMSKWQWDNFTSSCDNCLELLSPALGYVRDVSLARQICDNLITIAETARDSCSWKFDVNSLTSDHYVQEYYFTKEGKDIWTKDINDWKEQKGSFDSAAKEKVLNSIRGGRIKEEEDAARRLYWDEHSTEKEKLEAENTSLDQKKVSLSASLNQLPVLSEIKETQERIADLEKNLSGLGLFKGKEKKELRAKIAEQKEKLHVLNKKKEDDEAPIHTQIEEAEARQKEITEEFTKSRGRVSTVKEHFVFKSAVKDGKFTVTPQKLFEYFKTMETDEYQPSLETAPIAPLPFGKAWKISFKNPKLDPQKDSVECNIFTYAENTDSPIDVIAIPAQRNIKSAADFCKAASQILLSVTEDSTLALDEIEDSLCDVIYSKERSLMVVGPCRVEYAEQIIEVAGVTLPLGFGVIRVND